MQLFRNTSFNTSIETVSGNEVKKIIKILKHSKVPGYDAVTNSMIKQLPCNRVSHLVAIYNSALRLHHFPESGSGHNTQKGKDPKIPQNRRPISLFTCLGKVYERILLNRLNSQVIANNLFPDGSSVLCRAAQLLINYSC